MHHGERFPKHFTSFVSFSPVHCPLLALNRGRGACWWLDSDLKQAYLTLVSMLCASPSLRGLYTHTDTHRHTHTLYYFCSVAKSCPTLCNPMNCMPHTRFLCPSLSPRVFSNLRLSSRWCHSTISSSVAPFSSCPQSFPASGSFPVSRLSASGASLYRIVLEHILKGPKTL